MFLNITMEVGGKKKKCIVYATFSQSQAGWIGEENVNRMGGILFLGPT